LGSKRDKKSTLEYFGTLHHWVDEQLSEGKSVLIHCLAGAHRAGTASISYVMHAGKLSKTEAIAICQRQRPVINPIGSFPTLLDKLDKALRN
jgi:protein-tyrosine phosphatase